MLPFAREKLAPDFVFQQDGAGPHTSQMMLGPVRRLPGGRKLRLPGWFRLNNVPLLRFPSLSPDLNPIENLWSCIERKLAGKRFDTRDELWEEVNKEWKAIPLDTLINLVDSMPRRMLEVIKAKGGPTRY
jgi:hypothetical protein